MSWGQKLELHSQWLALAAAVVPSAQNPEISKLFKMSLNPDGFLQEAHVKLRPVDTAADGVFLCGIAHYPKHITETISQAYGAAGRAITILTKDSLTASGRFARLTKAHVSRAAHAYPFVIMAPLSFTKQKR